MCPVHHTPGPASVIATRHGLSHLPGCTHVHRTPWLSRAGGGACSGRTTSAGGCLHTHTYTQEQHDRSYSLSICLTMTALRQRAHDGMSACRHGCLPSSGSSQCLHYLQTGAHNPGQTGYHLQVDQHDRSWLSICLPPSQPAPHSGLPPAEQPGCWSLPHLGRVHLHQGHSR